VKNSREKNDSPGGTRNLFREIHGGKSLTYSIYWLHGTVLQKKKWKKQGRNDEISELTVRAGLCTPVSASEHQWECLPHMESNRWWARLPCGLCLHGNVPIITKYIFWHSWHERNYANACNKYGLCAQNRDKCDSHARHPRLLFAVTRCQRTAKFDVTLVWRNCQTPRQQYTAGTGLS